MNNKEKKIGFIGLGVMGKPMFEWDRPVPL